MNFKLICFTFFICALHSNSFGVNAWRYDYTYVKLAKGYFKFHRIPATWQDARLRCQFEGAVLASPYPGEVYGTMIDLTKSYCNDYIIFTGIHATFSSGDYHTIQGTPIKDIPLRWLKSEPNNEHNSQNCLTMTSEGAMADANCDEVHPYICYREKKGNEQMNACGTNDPAYVYSNTTGNCYKYHVVPRTWSRAHMACSAEGGYLAIVNSNAEATYIRNLYAQNPESTVVGNYAKNIAWFGFRVWNNEGEYRTIHDQTLKEAGYTLFGSGEPNNPTTEHCGCTFRDGILCNYFCTEPIPFICEKNPKSLTCDEEECVCNTCNRY